MQIVLPLVIGVVVAVLLLRPAPRTRMIYVPVEVTEEPSRLGCLPMVAAVLVVLVGLALLSGL